MKEALDAYQMGLAGYGRKRSFREIADEFGVKKSTLERRFNGKGCSTQKFHTDQQKLTAAEENVLANFVSESAGVGFPLSHREIIRYADAVLQSRLGASESLGKQWIFRFLDRHHEKLQTHWSRPLDMQRANALNPQAVKSWFEILDKFVVQLGIRPEDMYGMDESGFPPANQGRCRVVGGRGTKTQHKQGGGDRENVTAIVTICADGTTIPPMIIYKGKHFMQKWNDGNTCNA